MTRWPPILAIVLMLGLPQFAGAEVKEDTSGIFTLEVENDLFGAGTDRHYTNGMRFSWISAESTVPDWVRTGASYVPVFAIEGRKRLSYSLGQNMFTPDDITRTDAQPDDRSYAGWLYAGVGLISDTGSHFDNLELNIGLIGPASLAEFTQKGWHDAIGATRPEGWSHQLKTEPGVVLFYERKWRNRHEITPRGLGIDLIPHAGFALGNVFTYGAAGVTMRFGDDLPNDYGPPRIRPSLPGSGYFIPDDRFGWYLFAGVEGRAVGRNIFLDGNTFADSHSVDKRHWVGDLQFGAAVTLGRVRLAYTHVIRTEEFVSQENPDQFGSFSVSVRF
ncbi:MAG: lipid A deacylase LpxR family protein [Rhodospirillales bacterium]|nr:lipid A deacylase LpxR family protein [Rhodospirillales bacterium]